MTSLPSGIIGFGPSFDEPQEATANAANAIGVIASSADFRRKLAIA